MATTAVAQKSKATEKIYNSNNFWNIIVYANHSNIYQPWILAHCRTIPNNCPPVLLPGNKTTLQMKKLNLRHVTQDIYLWGTSHRTFTSSSSFSASTSVFSSAIEMAVLRPTEDSEAEAFTDMARRITEVERADAFELKNIETHRRHCYNIFLTFNQYHPYRVLPSTLIATFAISSESFSVDPSAEAELLRTTRGIFVDSPAAAEGFTQLWQCIKQSIKAVKVRACKLLITTINTLQRKSHLSRHRHIFILFYSHFKFV